MVTFQVPLDYTSTKNDPKDGVIQTITTEELKSALRIISLQNFLSKKKNFLATV